MRSVRRGRCVESQTIESELIGLTSIILLECLGEDTAITSDLGKQRH